ncbi:hypothetical protein P152DRAFT_451679 [Eremomyces bilateralis CBS 781.70]|uniref:D-aminoacyl-tRNA deacylase n=1 Tax=Eremomyces bilateralis CBS 781.70 TaxID=1392243 RepID=A0A6G1FV02_9PEZI|nr:uncharacterized protein P152DRAFT_451679 [Eremomyces bilateralis CBS 781.70]KAF1809725.1 hypothetical protein P152DRAFT_451679 [Eremomyces bilateralis CBS 781.70]
MHRRTGVQAVLQRVKSASVTVDDKLISSIGKGLLVLVGVSKDDTLKDVESMASKVLKFKMWEDDKGAKWKKSVQDVDGEVLCGLSPSIYMSEYEKSMADRIPVSQFTLLASTKKGNKPDFHRSAAGDVAKNLYTTFFQKVQKLYSEDKVKDGVFQAMMDVALVNDGPVTITIDTAPPKLDMAGEGPVHAERTISVDELIEKLEKMNPGFKFPPELLE